MKLESLEKLLIDNLKDLYDAEKQLVKALPKMAKAASSEELRSAFEEHLEETKEQVQRLERVFEIVGAPARGKSCAGMKGLIEEGSELIEAKGEPAVLDAGLIGAAQKVEHYEMASYGTVRDFAQLLDHTDAADLLQKTLDEEKATDKKLTQLASRSINTTAAKTMARA